MAAASLNLKSMIKISNFMTTHPTYVSGKYGKIHFERVSEGHVRVRQVKLDGTTGYIDLADEDMGKLAKGLFARHKQLHPEEYQVKKRKTSKLSITPGSTHMQELKAKHENAYNKWTVEEEVLLKRYHSEGKTNSEIGKLLKRNTGAVESRLRKLGLTANTVKQADSPNSSPENVDPSKA